MGPISGFIRARLSRVIFAWFAVSIALTAVAVGVGVSTYMLVGGQSHWQLLMERGERFVSDRMSEVWDDASRRRILLDSMGENLNLQVELRDMNGKLVDRGGPEVCAAGVQVLSISRDGQRIGSAHVCDPTKPPLGRIVFPMLVLAFALWAASALIASRIARPLRRLTNAASEFGAGDLEARAPEIQDQSELAELSSAFNEMASRIGAQIEEHHALLAEVSHELRTPLGHLRLLVELLRADNGESRHLDGLEVEVETLDLLVDQLLAKSRLDFSMERSERLDATRLVVAACESVGVDVSLLHKDAGAFIQGDVMLLRSALTNLLRNAETHGEGVTEIQIRIEEQWVVFEVSDEGPGIIDFDTLTDAFVRGSKETKGLGLGLSLVQRIVDAHDGQLEFANGEKGAIATLKLPMV